MKISSITTVPPGQNNLFQTTRAPGSLEFLAPVGAPKIDSSQICKSSVLHARFVFALSLYNSTESYVVGILLVVQIVQCSDFTYSTHPPHSCKHDCEQHPGELSGQDDEPKQYLQVGQIHLIQQEKSNI